MSGVQALWVYQADASGHPVGAGGSFGSCSDELPQVRLERAEPRPSSRPPARGRPPRRTPVQGEQDSVGVYLRVNHTAVTSVFFSSLGLDSYTVMRLEPIPALQAGGCK